MMYLGGFDVFWEYLPRTHRMAFPAFNEAEGIYGDKSYPAVGIFWQDAMANSAMFYFLNQGMVMRLMAAKSIKDSRKAVISMLAILMLDVCQALALTPLWRSLLQYLLRYCSVSCACSHSYLLSLCVCQVSPSESHLPP